MLKLMYDGREFRLSDGRVVNLADANIWVDNVSYSFGEIRVEARVYGEIKRFNTEFEFELFRNSCKPHGLFMLGYNNLNLIIAGELVNFCLQQYASSADYADVSMFGGLRIEVPIASAGEIAFTVPMYKENQCI